MSLYQYKALNKGGKKEVNLIHAESIARAKEELKKKQILFTEIKSYHKNDASIKISPPLLIGLTKNLSALLQGGLPLYESLLTLEEKYTNTKLHPILLSLTDGVKKGRKLSELLEQYPAVFSKIYRVLMQTGEESGTLTTTCSHLTTLLQQEYALRKTIRAALFYPAFLSVFALGVIILLLFVLIPSMSELFEGRPLHPITEFILHLSIFLKNHPYSILLSAVLVGTSITFASKNPFMRKKLEKGLISIPLIKKLTIQLSMARFFQIFSTLLQRGVSMIDSLILAKEGMKIAPLQEVVTQGVEKILQGQSLSNQLTRSSLIPPLVIRMLAVGEESGKMGEITEHLSQLYHEEVESNFKRLTNLLQPVILVILGTVVALLLLAILLPLTDVGSFLD